MKHTIKDVMPSGDAVQWDQLDEFLTQLEIRNDPTDEISKPNRVLCVSALVKSEGEG